jgi:hypothetical protein
MTLAEAEVLALSTLKQVMEEKVGGAELGLEAGWLSAMPACSSAGAGAAGLVQAGPPVVYRACETICAEGCRRALLCCVFVRLALGPTGAARCRC